MCAGGAGAQGGHRMKLYAEGRRRARPDEEADWTIRRQAAVRDETLVLAWGSGRLAAMNGSRYSADRQRLLRPPPPPRMRSGRQPYDPSLADPFRRAS